MTPKSLDRLGFHNADVNVIGHFNFIISREQSLIDQVTFANSTKEDGGVENRKNISRANMSQSHHYECVPTEL